ncbi:MAG: hypothetical protein ACOY71_05355 [Gemmatimonadota bacterium]
MTSVRIDPADPDGLIMRFDIALAPGAAGPDCPLAFGSEKASGFICVSDSPRTDLVQGGEVTETVHPLARLDSGRPGEAQPLVDIRADSHGARIRVTDTSANEIVHLKADSSGAELRVKGKPKAP